MMENTEDNEVSKNLLSSRGMNAKANAEETEFAGIRSQHLLLRSIIETSPDAIFLKDITGAYLLINSAGARFLGRKIEEVIGCRDNDLFDESTAEEIRGQDYEVLRSSRSISGEFIATAQGIKRTFYFNKAPYFDEAGALAGLIGIARDITEKRRAEEEIRSLARFCAENPYPILRFSTEGKLLYANPASQGLLDGWHLKVGQCVSQDLKHLLSEAYASQHITEVEVPAGDNLFSLRLTPVRDAGYLNVYGFDITGGMLAEQALREVEGNDFDPPASSHRCVQRVGHPGRPEAEEPTEVEHRLQQFANIVSRDMSGHVSALLDTVSGWASRNRNPADSAWVAQLLESARRIEDLLNELSDYSNPQKGESETSRVELISIVESSLQRLAASIAAKGASVTYDSLPEVSADAVQLGKLFQHLIGNALKFHGQNAPQVHISAKKRKAEWVISVRDNGIGFEPELSEKIFYIFQKPNRSDLYPGVGLGLAICKKIIERHQGRIWAESQPGKGATFHFTLPA